MRSICGWLTGIGLLLLFAPSACCDDQPGVGSIEHQVKSAFIHKMVNFIEWPAGAIPDEDFVIGVLGDGPIFPALVSIRDRSLKGRKPVIKHFRHLDDMQACQILFINPSLEYTTAEVLARIGDSPVLTIGEADGLASQGVIVNFVIIDNRVRFEVNVTAADRADLRVSSKLLRLALIAGEE